MITIYQGETLTFTLSGDEFKGYAVRAALYPSAHYSFRRDCACGESSITWDNVDVIDGVAVWTLSSEQSSTLGVGKYAMEVALQDVESNQYIKESTTTIIEVKQSYTR